MPLFLQLAREQGELSKEIAEVEREMSIQDGHIRRMQAQLKDAESLLATSIFQVQFSHPAPSTNE